jgi:predicted nucleic acid-binding Zn ribbon protein
MSMSSSARLPVAPVAPTAAPVTILQSFLATLNGIKEDVVRAFYDDSAGSKVCQKNLSREDKQNRALVIVSVVFIVLFVFVLIVILVNAVRLSNAHRQLKERVSFRI